MSNLIAGTWTEHKNNAGRPYWFNSVTKESVWEKPDTLRTPVEKALAQTPWKATESPNGKIYYYHKETKETRWDIPDEVKEAVEKAEKEAAAKPAVVPTPTPAPSRLIAPNFTAGTTLQGANSMTASGGDLSLVQAGAPGPLVINGTTPSWDASTPTKPLGALPARPNQPEDPVIPHNGFLTYEEGEKAFFHLLRKAGVDPTWTWEQTMRAIITDPLYKALNSLAERKSATQKFIEEMKKKEQEEKDARLNKLRPALRNMLKGNPNVHHYSTFPTADKLFCNHPIWQQAKIEHERRLIFEEYVNELKQREVSESREARGRSINKLMNLFKSMGLDALTRWRQTFDMVLESDQWGEDQELKKLPALDVLLAWEDFSRASEREFQEKSRKEAVEKSSKERKAREAFKELLHELLEQGKIKAKTSWKDIYPFVSDDSRYLNILGNPGSTPLELFWDEVDKLDQVFDEKLGKIEAALKAKDFTFTTETTDRDFTKALKDEDVGDVNDSDLKDMYAFMIRQEKRRLAEEQKRAERRQKRLQEDFRYSMKKLDPPIDIDGKYEDAESSLKELPEFEQLEDEGRRTAFAKFIKRQKEKLRDAMSEDGGSTTSRKRKERSRDRRSERDEGDRHDKHDRTRDRDEYSGKRHRSDTYDRRDRDRDRERDGDRSRDYRDREGDSYREREREKSFGKSRKDGHRERERDKEREYEDRRRREHGRKRDERDWDGSSPSVSAHTHKHRSRDRREEPASARKDHDGVSDHESKEKDHKRREKVEHDREETPEEGEI